MDRRTFPRLALGVLATLTSERPLIAATLSDADRLLIETTQLLGIASASCDANLVPRYLAQRQAVTAHLEAKYPGQTVDWRVIPAPLMAR